MKKLISFVLLVVLLVAMMVPTAFAAQSAKVTVSEKTIESGVTSATLTVDISNNPGFVSGKVVLSYDSSKLKLVSLENDMFKGETWVATNSANHYSGGNAVTGDGTLVKATFEVLTTEAGRYPVSVTVSGMRDAEEEELINVTLVAGAVIIKATETDPTETDPTKPSETDPTKPSETDPTKPSETDPTKPSETDPTKPSETDPTKPSETDPTKPSETDPTKPSETDPTKPSETDPTKPSETEPHETEKDDPTKDDEPKTGDIPVQYYVIPVMVLAAAVLMVVNTLKRKFAK